MINILLLDLETTGIEPRENQILEVAVIAAQINKDKLEVGGSMSLLVRNDDFNPDTLNDVVYKMHKKSGLLDDLETKETFDVRQAERKLIEFLDEEFGSGAKQIQLGGSSVHFDKAYIEWHMPLVFKRLSYRIFDTTYYRSIRDEIFKVKEDKSVAHRAMDDISYSLKLLKESIEVINKSYLNEAWERK